MPQGLKELVGRAMVDPDFVVDLQRSPDVVLAQFQLTEEELATVRQALDRLGSGSSGQRAHALRNALIRRVAT